MDYRRGIEENFLPVSSRWFLLNVGCLLMTVCVCLMCTLGNAKLEELLLQLLHVIYSTGRADTLTYIPSLCFIMSN